MIRRPTLVLLIVLGGLLLLTWYLQNREEDRGTSEVTPATAEVSLFEYAEDEVIGFRIAADSGFVVELERTETSEWQLIVPAGDVDPDEVEAALQQIKALRIVRAVEVEPHPSEVGLDSPTYTISITNGDGIEQILWIGDLTPTGSGYYAQLTDRPTLVVAKGGVDYLIGLLTDPPILPFVPAGPEPISSTPTP